MQNVISFMRKIVFFAVAAWCMSPIAQAQFWYSSTTDTIPLYPFLHYGEVNWPEWNGSIGFHDGISCTLMSWTGLPNGSTNVSGVSNTAVKYHASDTIHVVGLAMGRDGSGAQYRVKMSLYDSNMTLLKTVGPYYNLADRATKNDTQMHPFYIKPLPTVGTGMALMTFVYFDDGPVDVIGDYYVSASHENGRYTFVQYIAEYHSNPPFLIRGDWIRNFNDSTWIADTSRCIVLTFPIITPRCDTIEWASAATEGDSVVRVQWDSTVDEVQVCLMPMGETPDSTGIFVKDTAAFDTMVVSGDYDVYVRRVCNERYLVCSDWTGPMTMLAPCEAPEMVLTADNDSCMTATWGGTRRPCEVSLVAAGEEPGEPELCVGHEWSRCGLDPTGAYEMYIRLVCDTLGGRSAWGGPYRLTMPRYGIEGAEGLADGIRLSPNPATATVRLTVEGLQGEATVRVTDAAGREAARYALHGTWLDIDVSRLPKGAYTVSVTTSEGTAARRLVVQ